MNKESRRLLLKISNELGTQMGDKWKISTIVIVLIYLIGTVSALAKSVHIILTSTSPILSSDITSIGQLFADVILFPTVIIGFWITITEFRKSQILPKLKLIWKGDMAIDLEDDCLVLKTSKHDVKTFFLTVFVKNDGDVIATWYRLAFDIPYQLAKPLSETHSVQWRIGDKNYWGSSVSTQNTHHEFKSNGQYALYPGEEIHVATLEIRVFPQLSYPNRVYVHHSVVTDKTSIQHGVCKIKFRPEDFTHEAQE